MLDEIRFGTDGWRAVIADGFTFANVRRVTAAIARAARHLTLPPGIDPNRIVVGYDRRFLSAEFALAAAELLQSAGFEVILSDEPTPSQTISHAVKARHALGGVIVTASHNPAAYNGIKFKGWYGGSAVPEIYAAIIANLDLAAPTSVPGGSLKHADILTPYIETLRTLVDVPRIRQAGVRILHDPIYGASAGLLQRIFASAGAGDLIEMVRGEVNPGFGGVNPEPIPENLRLTSEWMARGGRDLAICNDGDADRVGILDETGLFVSPHKTIALLAIYLVREKKLQGELVKTFSTSRLVERVATGLGAVLHETAVGFKYVADLMLTRNILIGGEESGGIGFGSFLPERDGILSGLLVAECVAHYGKPLSKIVDEMEEEFGRLHYGRRDIHSTSAACEMLISRARSGDLEKLFTLKVANREEKDGVKLNFVDGSWLLFRASGTEPLIRIYCESPDPEIVQRMLATSAGELV